MHKENGCQLCIINEFLKNAQKWVVLAKKSLQNEPRYYKIVKRGMTYDDVGGYQLQEVTDFAVNFHGECPNREFGRHGHCYRCIMPRIALAAGIYNALSTTHPVGCTFS